jgi:hypothetical protein
MTAYIEVEVVGDHRACIEAASIVGVINSPGMGADHAATPESPMTLILRGGDSLEGVYGLSAAMLIIYAAGARAIMRVAKKRIGMLVTVEQRDEFENEIVTLRQQMDLDHGRTS